MSTSILLTSLPTSKTNISTRALLLSLLTSSIRAFIVQLKCQNSTSYSSKGNKCFERNPATGFQWLKSITSRFQYCTDQMLHLPQLRSQMMSNMGQSAINSRLQSSAHSLFMNRRFASDLIFPLGQLKLINSLKTMLFIRAQGIIVSETVYIDLEKNDIIF